MQIGHAGLGLVVALCACAVYDPVDEIDHHVFPDTASAIAAVLDEAGGIVQPFAFDAEKFEVYSAAPAPSRPAPQE